MPPTFRSNREMFAAMSIQPLEHATEKAAPPKEPSPRGDAEQEANTDRIIRCMKKALRTSLTNISMEQKDRPLNPTIDFGFKARVKFGDPGMRGCCAATGARKADESTSDDSDEEGDLGSFEFTDYAPMCYRHIREFFGIEWKQFQEVLCGSKWHSIPTPGKSTAQLFFCGQNWVVKTMTREESKFLRTILHRYYYHVRDNPYTLLPHFVGHHSLELSLSGSVSKISFVIMQNVFATPNKIHEKFDLKGSTIGRYATPEERLKQTCTKKDLDVNRPMRIGPSRRALLLAQMRRDCDFLRRSQVMDYSFLIGIHYHDPSKPIGAPSPMRTAKVPPQEDERCFTADQGGMMSLTSPLGEREVYYVGIIDILQEYNLWKFSETVVRSVVDDRTEISSVDPKDYSSRFVAFMSTIIA
jgi:1-phosphatidylinositol-4-phosphate 5-kinase